MDVTATFEGLGVPILDMVTGKGAIRAYITKSNYDVRQAELAHAFAGKYGDQIKLQGAEDGNGLSVVTVVGEAMATDNILLANVVSDVIHAGNSVGIDTVGFWPSPNCSAIYAVVPTDSAKRFAVAVYDQFFDGSL